MSERIIRVENPGPGEGLKVAPTEMPACPDNGILIKTLSAGICHSDVHLESGKVKIHDGVEVPLSVICDQIKYPVVLGHEVCGTVHAIGTGTKTDLAVGDLVSVFPWSGCGDCGICNDGRTNFCPVGGMATDLGTCVVPGGQQSYMPLQNPDNALKIDKSTPPNVGCLFGCSALTAYNACEKIKPSVEDACRAGDASVLIIGAGGVGLWAVQIAKAIFPQSTKIFVADITEEKLAIAKEYGADECILWPIGGDDAELVEKTKQATGGIDAAIDFVGMSTTTSKAFDAMKKGGTLCAIGLAGGTFPLSLVGLILRNITIVGCYVGTRQQMHDLIALYQANKVRPPPITDVTPDEANDALQKLRQGKVVGRSTIKFA